MNLLPLIGRELQAESRNPVNQWMRLLGAGVMLFAAATFLNRPVPPRSGQELFTDLHQLLFVTIWLLVPLMTADCVSREKREGTLGLLFLTPLKPGEIMMAKTLAHGLRAATCCLAVTPVLILPLLVGGVSWTTIAASLLTNASAFLWALAAGLMASVLSRSLFAGWVQALLWAAAFLVGLSLLNGLALFTTINVMAGGGRALPSSEWLVGIGLLALWNAHQILDAMTGGTPPAMQRLWLALGCLILFVSFGGVTMVWQIGAWRLRRTWQELPRSKKREDLERQFSQPRFAKSIFRAGMRRRLETNPIGWLERRHWMSRAAGWVVFGVLGLLYTLILTHFSSGRLVLGELNPLMAWGLAGAMALTSCASFRRERESGVLELLLTTPLSPEQIIQGRLRGIWVQFLPSLFLFVGITAFTSLVLEWEFRPTNSLLTGWRTAALFLTIPVCGLWLSLRLRNYIASLLVTLGVTVLLPHAFIKGALWFNYSVLGSESLANPFIPLVSITCLVLGGWGACKLRQSFGWLGWILCMGLLAVLVESAMSHEVWLLNRFNRPSPVAYGILLLGSQLALAGFAYERLLRNLRHRTFAFKS